MTPAERHNQLAPAILCELVKHTETTVDAMIVAESVLYGLLLLAAPGDYSRQVAHLELIADNVIRRLQP